MSFIHVPAATIYFTATSASLITHGAEFLKDKYKRIVGGITISTGIASLGVLATQVYSGLAIKETVASTLLGLWVFGTGASMLFDSTNSGNTSTQ